MLLSFPAWGGLTHDLKTRLEVAMETLQEREPDASPHPDRGIDGAEPLR